jgi:hypothetical protein
MTEINNIFQAHELCIFKNLSLGFLKIIKNQSRKAKYAQLEGD